MKPTVKYLTLLMIPLFLSACGSDQVFKSYHKFDKNTWKRINDDVLFEVEISDSTRKYDITIPIRHASFYPYQYLEIGFNIYSHPVRRTIR
jgi:gliding motility-associated lipoprotein GldH